MLGASAARLAPSALATVAALACTLSFAPRARAVEAFDGRLQLHGFAEVQLRALSEDLDNEVDLAQWYNVLNLEFEADIAPDGWGPTDLIEAFVRVEARYDCVWTRGCGTMRSANAYGDRSRKVPPRFRDAKVHEWSGAIPPTPPGTYAARANVPRDAFGLTTAPIPRIGDTGVVNAMPPFRTRTDIRPGFGDPVPAFPSNPMTGAPIPPFGPNCNANNPDPNAAPCAFTELGDDFFVHEPFPGEGLPGFDALFAQRGPDNVLGTADDPAIYTFGPILHRKHAYSWALADFKGPPGFNAGTTQLIGPWRPDNFIQPNALLRTRANPFRGAYATSRQIPGDPLTSEQLRTASYRGRDPLDPFLQGVKNFLLNDLNPPNLRIARSLTQPRTGDVTGDSFAGDYSGIIPCIDPNTLEAEQQRKGQVPQTNCVPNSVVFSNRQLLPGERSPVPRTYPGANVRIAFDDGSLGGGRFEIRGGGAGELPMRPAPDLSNLTGAAGNPGGLRAQGIYYPSSGLRRELAAGDLDPIDFNYDQLERSFNRGQSQQQTGELKEAYLDIEWLDSRLWTRIGKQSIVWGKTELFRTTDQFNPQDLALASLPSLEESRISLWAFRAVYSLYDVGPLQDVRLEAAFNFDEFQPADLGAAGEPFTVDAVGSLTSGIFFHSLTGVGVAGIDRPDNPWDNIKGLEVGGRIEWRWDRFSFALTDFYGYNDFPFIDRIWTYDRTVDPATGRPLVGGTPFAGQTGCDTPALDRNGDGQIDEYAAPLDPNGPTRAIIDSKSPASYTGLGIGAQLNCLKGGGSGDFENFDPIFGGAQNALENHYANQQIFAWICSVTLGIAAALDPGSCAWNVFGSPAPIVPGAVDFTFAETTSSISSGDQDGNVQIFLRVISDNLKPSFPRLDFVPVTPTNLDQGPGTPCPTDPNGFDPLNTECALWDGLIMATSTQFNRTDPNNPLPTSHTATLSGEFLDQVNFVRFLQNPANPNFLPPGQPLPDGSPTGLLTSTCRIIDPDGFSRFRQRPDVFDQGDMEDPAQFNNIWEGLLDFPEIDTSPSGICPRVFYAHDAIDLLTLDSTLTNFQKAMLGCGAFFGTRCDSAVPIDVLPEGTWGTVGALNAAIEFVFPEGGGIDFLNTDASVLEQSWPGIEGTEPSSAELANSIYWTTTGRKRQPGTAQVIEPLAFADGGNESGRVFGPQCTRPDGQGGLVTLPGCRGIESIELGRDSTTDVVTSVVIRFEDDYDPAIDGCLVGGGSQRFDPQNAIGHIGGSAPGTGVDVTMLPNGNGYQPALAQIQKCHTDSFSKRGDYQAASVEFSGSDWLWHPLAGCLSEDRSRKVASFGDVNEDPDAIVDDSNPNDPVFATFDDCGSIDVNGVSTARSFWERFGDLNGDGIVDIEQEFLNTLVRTDCDDVVAGTCEDVAVTMAQMFRNELAAVSWNFLQFLVATSCSESNEGRGNVEAKPECFDPGQALRADKCSFNAPHLCTNVRGFLAVAGVTRNTVLAGGNPTYGRRTFVWHSGGEIVLRYEKRNVLGFSTDFAEDVTKSNWGMEFTWIQGLPFIDNDSFTNTSKSDTLNLTVSVDRPTFVNFLNANRTVFINSQWFFQYVTDYKDSFPSKGPWNVLFTFAVFTGYFQDRLLPTFVSVFDVQSRSGGFLPNIAYRFTESFSATLGVNMFFGRAERHVMPVNEIAPASNRAPLGNDRAIAYQNGVENVLSLVRKRDEFYLRLRWTF